MIFHMLGTPRLGKVYYLLRDPRLGMIFHMLGTPGLGKV